MTLEEVKAALAPFAKFAELFTHNTLGVSYEDFYTKTLTVNGEIREFTIRGADFDRAKDAFDFLNGIEAKQVAAAKAEQVDPPKNETTAAKADAPAEPEAEAPTKKGKK